MCVNLMICFVCCVLKDYWVVWDLEMDYSYLLDRSGLVFMVCVFRIELLMFVNVYRMLFLILKCINVLIKLIKVRLLIVLFLIKIKNRLIINCKDLIIFVKLILI